jgi:hypothetical protein
MKVSAGGSSMYMLYSVAMDQTDLQTKIEQLRNSSYFVTTNDNGALVEKQSILLVLCQKKPAAEATTGRRVEVEQGSHSMPEDHAELGSFLTDLGLVFSLRSDEFATDAIVALDQSLVDEFLQAADNAVAVGRLFGYPQTAIDAFASGTLMSFEDQDALMESHSLPFFMPQFRLSQDYAQDEIKVLQDWHHTLQAYNFV